MNPWTVLDVNSDSSLHIIREAYLRKLGVSHPCNDPDMFQKIRSAYENALEKLVRAGKTFTGLDAFSCGYQTDAARPREHSIAHYIDELIDRVNFESENSAIFYLNESIKQRDFSDISFRNEFEQALQFTLATLVPFPVKLASHAIELFGWYKQDNEQQPCYLAAIRFLVSRSAAQQKQQELEDLSKKMWNRKARMAKALLGPYRPWLFRWLSLSQKNLQIVKQWFEDFDQHYPELLRYNLDQRTVSWWRDAISKPRLHGRHLIEAISLSCLASLLGLGALNLAIPGLGINAWLLPILFVASFAIIAVLYYLGINVSHKYKAKNTADEKPACNRISALCSAKIQTQVTYMPIFVMLFTLSMLLPHSAYGIFSFVAYGLLLAVFGTSLFFIINFVALILGFVFSTQSWFSGLGEISHFKLHTLCVMDITILYFLLNILIIFVGGSLRAALGIRRELKIDEMFYGFLLVTFILLIHLIGFGMLNTAA